MIVAHLIGGNEIEGFRSGKVFVNGEELPTSYEDLAQVCGSISLGDLDMNQSARKVQNAYIALVKEYAPNIVSPTAFVKNNHLTEEVCYSTYELDMENKTLILKIDTYN